MSETAETPTQTVVARSQPEEVTLEPSGRKIVVREMTPVENFRFKKVIGPFWNNGGYVQDAVIAASVRNVDGLPMPVPQREADIEFILEKLGHDGWMAVQLHFVAKIESLSNKAEDAKN